MFGDFKYKISVITATFNSENEIKKLIVSLQNQSYSDFEWIIVDGASTDKTVEILRNIDDLNIKIISEPDFGIYDALNKGIKICSGEFYLVVGSDDILYEDAIKYYTLNISNNIDILTANVQSVNKILMPNKGAVCISGIFSYISNHSVGVVIRKSIHDEYGYYSKKYPIAADFFFIAKAAQKCNIKNIEIIVGFFNDIGVSSRDKIGTLTENYRVMLDLGFNKYIQTILFFWRVLKRILLDSLTYTKE
ncbi:MULTISPECIES: glycosyltransferase [Acinetobacter]|uniref:glycosyltransferase n=1 Tax=Acinetobacter TaxID=469 RepID=UPI000EA23F25|nr:MULTISPECIES: glycosyltransferase [Acinetobacter]RKG46101.1 glycosyltransferase [Acinetobacter cumulans]RZG61259.1 glycosyltransferase [Acinetobacter sp. WCHAc060006]